MPHSFSPVAWQTIGCRSVRLCAAPLRSQLGATILTSAIARNSSASAFSPAAWYPSSLVSNTRAFFTSAHTPHLHCSLNATLIGQQSGNNGSLSSGGSTCRVRSIPEPNRGELLRNSTRLCGLRLLRVFLRGCSFRFSLFDLVGFRFFIESPARS